MISYPHINPVLLSIGPIQIRWYGIMYILGFLTAYLLIQKQERARQVGLIGTVAQDLVFYLAVGVVIGGRLGYIIFYQYNDYMLYIKHPLEIIATWHGGMSFHGGFLGALIAGWVFSRVKEIPFSVLADSVAVTTPIGLGLGRIGNFINGELVGRPSTLPWAMIFPDAGPVPRHPSQLYNALVEGLVLFLLLWNLRKRGFRDGMMGVFFLLFYGTFRFFLEFFREPDPQVGFLLGGLTMGQILCFAMIVTAGLLAVFIQRRPSGKASQDGGRHT